VHEWLDQHPRSVWWIANIRIVDYCRIGHGAKLHNTAILGKYLPRKTTFWERAKGFSDLQHDL